MFLKWAPIPPMQLAALGECGRLPLKTHYFKRVIKYWLRLIEMHDNFIPKQCYLMSKQLDYQNRTNWVTHVKNILYKFGFGFVWIAQEVGDPDMFLNKFSLRFKDCCFQDWSSLIDDCPKLESYKLYKTLLNTERYLSVVSNFKYRQAMSIIRCSNHPLQIEVGRRYNIPKHERYCTFCLSQGIKIIEDEFHFVMKCSLYYDIRKSTIHCITRYATTGTFIQIMCTQSDKDVNIVAEFMYKALQERKKFFNQIVLN